MKLEKAIEILGHERSRTPDIRDPDLIASLKLGIEAIKEVIRARNGNPALDGELLPGETLEG